MSADSRAAAPRRALSGGSAATSGGVATYSPLNVDAPGTGDTLTATGRFSIKQTDFGITPISIGGVVKVKDELNITFTIATRER